MTYVGRSARPRPILAAPMGDWIDDMMNALINGTEMPDDTDNVNQTAGGGTTTSAADFTTVGGVCKPRNFPALDAVRVFQRQLNRVAQVKGFSKIVVDGAVGPGTLALFRQVQSVGKGSVMGDPSTCTGVAPDVDVLAAQVKDLADTLGAPAQVSGPVAIATPTILTKSNKVVIAPDAGAGLLGAVASMSGIEKVALVGVAGAIGYLLIHGKKRRK